MPEDDLDFQLQLDTQPEGSSLAITPRVGRDEMNLAEFPFALLSDRAPEGVSTVKFEDTVEGKDGKLVRRAWTVTGSDQFGLPLAADEQVYVVLMEVTKEQGFGQRTMSITRYDLIKRLGWPDKGDSYRRLRAALDRLLGVTIKAEKAFWDNAKQRYVDVGFHIIDDYALYDEAPGRKRREQQESLPLSFITWNQVIFRSFQAGNIKQLDTAFYFSLRSSLSRRLYRYLDKKRYDGKGHYRIGLRKLAFEKLGMSRTYYPSHIKQELHRAHDELLSHGFLKSVEYQHPSAVSSRRRSDGGGEELVVYYFTQRKHRTGNQLPQPEQAGDLLDDLAHYGVTPAVGRQLIQQSGDEVRVQLQYLPYRAAQDAAAVLVEAIRGKWEPPASYLKARTEEQKRQEEQKRRTQQAREKAEHDAQLQLVRATSRALFDSLDEPNQQRTLDMARERVAEISPLVAQRPEGRAYEAMCREQLAQILQAEYPDGFETTRQRLIRESRLDLNDDL